MPMKKTPSLALVIIHCINAPIWTALFISDLLSPDRPHFITILDGVAAVLFLITAIAYLIRYLKHNRPRS